MGKIIVAIISCIIAIGIFCYAKKQKENKTPMAIHLKNGIMFNIASIIGYVFYLIADKTIIGNIGNIVMSIAVDWMLCCIFAYITEFTSMQKIFHRTKVFICIFVLIDNVLLLIGQKDFHILLGAVFFIAMAIILIRKKQLAPTIYVRKYMVVFIALLIVVGLELISLINPLAINLFVPVSAILLLFLYYLTFEHKQNDFVQRMQMLIVEDIKSPIVYFDFEKVIASFNQSADNLFGFSKRYNIYTLDYTLEDFLKENDFYIIKDLDKDYIFEWMNNGIYYRAEYRRLFDRSNDDRRVGTIISFNDITEQKRSAREMEYMLTHDYLTGLYNRNFMRLNQENIINQGEYPISIALFEVNGMKMINNFYGEDKGDEVILGVGEIMQRNIQENYIPVRLDGDEFMIIMPDTKEERAIQVMEAIRKDTEKNVAPSLKINIVYSIGSMLNEQDTLESCMIKVKHMLYQKQIQRELQ